MEQVVAKYLHALNIPVSRKYCRKLIASHPDYPSLLSIADTLERLGIRYKAARMQKEQLCNLKYPYLLCPEKHSRELRMIRGWKDLPSNGAADSEGSDEQAIVLMAEPTNAIADEEHNRQRSQERFLRALTGVLALAAAGLVSLVIIPSMTWLYAALLLTALAGVAVGYLLVAKDVGISYQPVETFCRAGRKTNCDAVLNSEAARLLRDKITFSDAAISYFLFQLIAVSFLLPSAPSLLGILAMLSGVTIPVIGFSLYYQGFSVKTWCRLCLLVDGILAVQAALFGYLYFNGFMAITTIVLQSIMQAGLLFLATGSFVFLLKNKIKVANQTEQDLMAASRIKYAPDVFMHLLSRENRVDITPFEEELIIGNPQAPVNILMAASLGCRPCKYEFERAVQLVQIWPGKVNLTVRLKTYGRNDGKLMPTAVLLGHWQHINGTADASVRTEQLLREWYASMSADKFLEKYSVDEEGRGDVLKQLLDQYAEWFTEADIQGTPTFFVNGRKLPEAYTIKDMAGLVPALAEKNSHNQVLVEERTTQKKPFD